MTRRATTLMTIAQALTRRERRAITRSLAGATLAIGLLLAGCSSTPFVPVPIDNPMALPNLQSETALGLTVSTVLLNDDQARQHFGVDLGDGNVQAMWVRVRNATDRRWWLIRNAVDPDLYSADEAAFLARDNVKGEDYEKLQQYFRDQTVRVLMEPDHVTQGFLFLPQAEGGRYAEIRLASDAWESQQSSNGEGAEPAAGVRNVTPGGGTLPDGRPAESAPRGSFEELRFGFALTLPDGDFDYERLDVQAVYPDRLLPDFDTEQLRAELERLPCCAANEDGEAAGDPLNVVIVGEEQDMMYALARAGWSFTHRITPASVTRLISAALEGEGYAVAPVSALYAFDRKQDIALQRARRNITQRNHMRLWLAPFTHRGRAVWVGQVSRDIGVKLTTKSPTLTTHVIDPEVDITREYLLHSLLAGGYVARFGFVGGGRASTREDPALNLADDPYFTDGLRLVVMLSAYPLPYTQVRSLQWEQSDAPVAEGQSPAANANVYPISAEALRD